MKSLRPPIFETPPNEKRNKCPECGEVSTKEELRRVEEEKDHGGVLAKYFCKNCGKKMGLNWIKEPGIPDESPRTRAQALRRW